MTVTVTTGTYATAASYQAELQTDVSAQTAAAAGFTGSVTVNVRDLGGGAWSVEFVRNASATGDKLTTTAVGASLVGIAAASASTAVNNGGVFQVGANVTANDQITLSISDARITGGTDGAFTALAGIDVTNTASYASAQTLVDGALSEVSNDRGQLGAVQNRFQATISNLQVDHPEPHGVGVVDRRHRHEPRDGQLHQGPDPLAGRHRHARAGQRRPADDPQAPPVTVKLL